MTELIRRPHDLTSHSQYVAFYLWSNTPLYLYIISLCVSDSCQEAQQASCTQQLREGATRNTISSLHPVLPGECGGDSCVFSFQLTELDSLQTHFLHTQQDWGTPA